MVRNGAVEKAISLFRTPTLVRSLRTRPLPDDVIVLIRIAAGCPAAAKEAMAATGEPVHLLKEAATFYITQVLLHPGADSYRMLGASSVAPQKELRSNMAWLLRWLHPDLDQPDVPCEYSRRVVRAWENVKTPERRAIYDKERLLTPPSSPSSSPLRNSRRRGFKADTLQVSSPGSFPIARRARTADRNGRNGLKSAAVIIVLAAGAAWLSLAGSELVPVNPFRGSQIAAGSSWLDSVLGR